MCRLHQSKMSVSLIHKAVNLGEKYVSKWSIQVYQHMMVSMTFTLLPPLKWLFYVWNGFFCDNEIKRLCFPTNLHSFVSFGKTHKLHNAIDHWLAGVTRQAHVALDAVTKEERTVYADEAREKATPAFGTFRGREGRLWTGGWTAWGRAGSGWRERRPRRGARSFMDEDEERLVFVVSLQL